ncbi:MAG: O-antigen ligase family protein [Ramlibacter sp.]|nr:O-antigen ligase family protein [Ramlibacter sp.]
MFSKFRKLRYIWLILVTGFYGLNLDQYLYTKNLGPAPKYWLLAFSTSGGLLFLRYFFKKTMIGSPVVVWLLAYVFMSLLWLALSPYPDAAEYGFSLVIATFLMITMALMAFVWMPEANKVLTPLLLTILILGICSVIWEMIDPAAFVNVGSGIIGRAAGFYQNPNSAALAFVMLFMLLIPRVSRAFTIWIALATLLGIALTFSRGALVVWLLVFILASWRSLLPRVSGVMILSLLIASWLWADSILTYFQEIVDPSWTNSIDRLRWVLGEGNLTDTAAENRRNIAQIALHYISESPILGSGLGFTWQWAQEESTHNLILRHMVEYGVLGIFIFPGLLLSIYMLAKKHVDIPWLVCEFTAIVTLSVFSHNMLEQGFFIFTLIAVCSPVKMGNRILNDQTFVFPRSFFRNQA